LTVACLQFCSLCDNRNEFYTYAPSPLYAERNQNFTDDAQKALKKRQKIVVYCGRGGTLTTGIKGRRGTFDDPDRCCTPEASASASANNL
jgi:hypothetical protein